jgi:PEP-CTERM motif
MHPPPRSEWSGPDNVHPDQIGYDLMGDTWAAAIQQAAPIPEPVTLLLLAIGTLGLIGWTWRRHGCAA